MTDERLRVLLAGNVHPHADGLRLFLADSGYDVVGEAASSAELFASARESDPDFVILGPELVGRDPIDAIRAAWPDADIVAVTLGLPSDEVQGWVDGHVPRGFALAALTAELARIGLERTEARPAVSAAPAEGRGPGRPAARVATLATAAAFVLGAWLLFATLPESSRLPIGQPGEIAPPSPTQGPPTTGTPESSAVLLDDVRSSLDRLAAAIAAGDIELATAEASTLISQRDRAIQAGYEVSPLDAAIASQLGPLTLDLPAPAFAELRAILGDLLPPPEQPPSEPPPSGPPETEVVVADSEPPVFACSGAGSAWHAVDVTITCTASDTASGLADAGDAAFVLRTAVPVGTEDANARTDGHVVCDAVGNCVSVGPIGGIKVDKRSPDVGCRPPESGWQGVNVAIGCTAIDRGSGLGRPSDEAFTLSTNVPQGAEAPSARTGTREVCDAAGNCVTAGPIGGIKIDRGAPVVTCEDPAGGWHAENVSVACEAADGGAGVAGGGNASFSLTTDVQAGAEDPDARTGTRRVCDRVGNCSTAGPVGGIKVDRKAPSISITTPVQGAAYLLNESLAAAFVCSDGGSGVASCSGLNNIDTSSAGSPTFAVSATDRIGNVSNAQVGYTVSFGIALLYDPSQPTKAVELRLVDAEGDNVSAASIVVRAMDIDGAPFARRLAFRGGPHGSYRLSLPGNLEDGPHVLHFLTGDDPVVHSASFTSGRGNDDEHESLAPGLER